MTERGSDHGREIINIQPTNPDGFWGQSLTEFFVSPVFGEKFDVVTAEVDRPSEFAQKWLPRFLVSKPEVVEDSIKVFEVRAPSEEQVPERYDNPLNRTEKKQG